jgi:membrane-bound inhibitor of C-type lysozyme
MTAAARRAVVHLAGMIQSAALRPLVEVAMPAPASPASRPPPPRTRERAVALVFALAVAACQTAGERMSPGLETTILPPEIDYACADGRALRVERAADGRSATAIVANQRWTLPRVDGANQEKYAQSLSALYLDGEAAMLEADGRVIVSQCKSLRPLPKGPEMRPYRF